MIRSLIAILVGAMLADAWLPGVVGFLASLNRAGFAFGALGGFACGLAIIALGYRLIHNSLVDADLRRDIEGIRKKHEARRI